MTRFAPVFFASVLIAVFMQGCCQAKTSESAAKTFGAKPTLTESVAITTLNTRPADYINKDVLVIGSVTDMCRHSGCWVEIQANDSTSIICRSLDESVHFTTDCLGRNIRLQGKLIYDPNAKGQTEMAGEGEVPHMCPAPKVLVSIQGAEVDLATSK